MGCSEVRELAPELALGAVDGAERAAALAHLAGCAACRAYVEELGEVADSLLLALPEADPPAGFESRVLVAAGVPGKRRRRRPRRWIAVAAAAALVLGGATAAVLVRRPAASVAATRSGPMLDQQRRLVGYATIDGGRVSVVLDDWGESGSYDVEVVLRDRRHVRVTSISLAGGRGRAEAAIGVPAGEVRSVWVTEPDHSSWCAARLD